MGGCFGRRDLKSQNVKLSAKIFENMDAEGKQKLTNKELTEYFKDYPQSSVKLMMNAMDFDQDGVIDRNEWFGYWQYIRRAGYEQKAIRKALDHFQKGTVFLNFPKADSYRSGVPRETVIKGIISELKDDQSMPVKLQP